MICTADIHNCLYTVTLFVHRMVRNHSMF